MNDARPSRTRDLAWQTVLAANRADTDLKRAEVDQNDLKRLAGMGLAGVTIESSAAYEAHQRVEAARKQFRTILNVAGLLDIKNDNPNPTRVQPRNNSPNTPNPELALSLRDKEVIQIVDIDGVPTRVLTRDGFKDVVAAVGNDVNPQVATRTMNCIQHIAFDSDNALWFVKQPATTDAPPVRGLNLDTLDELNQYVKANYSDIPNMGTGSVELLDSVTKFVEVNRENLLPE